MSHTHHISDGNFETEVLQSTVPVLVDYWAEWCGPCKMIAPILDEVAKEYGDRLKVAKLNIDENQATPPQIWYSRYPYPHALQKRKYRSHQSGRVIEIPAHCFY